MQPRRQRRAQLDHAVHVRAGPAQEAGGQLLRAARLGRLQHGRVLAQLRHLPVQRQRLRHRGALPVDLERRLGHHLRVQLRLERVRQQRQGAEVSLHQPRLGVQRHRQGELWV